MCGRYLLDIVEERLREIFGVAEWPDVHKRWNIAPTQGVLAVRAPEGAREAARLRWGLVPFWMDEEDISAKMINARAETAHESPAFRAAFKRRRCLIPASGFYEWKELGSGPKRPFVLRPRSGDVLAFAGLWERWEPDEQDGGGGEPIESCTILTTDAGPDVEDIHDRMPVILPEADWDAWLDPEHDDREALRGMLGPAPEGTLIAEPVGREVNNPRNERPEVAEPVDPEELDAGEQRELFE